MFARLNILNCRKNLAPPDHSRYVVDFSHLGDTGVSRRFGVRAVVCNQRMRRETDVGVSPVREAALHDHVSFDNTLRIERFHCRQSDCGRVVTVAFEYP